MPEPDPFTPARPLRTELGRLVTHGQLAAGWQCRWCQLTLSATPTGGMICWGCDDTAGQPT